MREIKKRNVLAEITPIVGDALYKTNFPDLLNKLPSDKVKSFINKYLKIGQPYNIIISIYETKEYDFHMDRCCVLDSKYEILGYLDNDVIKLNWEKYL